MRCADEIVAILNHPERIIEKLIGKNTVLVLDACDCALNISGTAIEKANSRLPSHEQIVESWELNSCASQNEIDKVLDRDVLNGDPDYKNVALYIESVKVRELLLNYFPEIPIVKC